MVQAPYRKLSDWLLERFGVPVRKVGVLAGFPCPNRDGTLASGGCSFCDPAAALPPGVSAGDSVTSQLEKGTGEVRKRFGVSKYIAYFQDGTPTNCPPAELEEKLAEALRFPGVVGLAVCTRPDCLPEQMADMLARVSEKALLWVELGLESASDSTLAASGRNHTVEDCTEALGRLGCRSLPAVLHVILGLPGETGSDYDRTADYVRESGAWGVKIHNLHILRGTRLETEYAAGRASLPDMEGYAAMAARFLSRLDPRTVVHRLCADAPSRRLVAPEWMLDKQAVIRAVERRLSDILETRGSGAEDRDSHHRPPVGSHRTGDPPETIGT